eukprot:11792872-Karenia_brevis.AAC.1
MKFFMQAHHHGAATEFQIQKIRDVVQHLALKHKQIAAGAQHASDNIHRMIQDLGDEIEVLGKLLDGREQAELHSR